MVCFELERLGMVSLALSLEMSTGQHLMLRQVFLGILDEEGFTRHSEGGQGGVEWFVSSLFIA